MPNESITKGELVELLEKLGEAPRYKELEPTEQQNENGPIRKPIDKWVQVPEPTRDWIEGLRPDDLKEIDDVRRWFRNTRIITSFGKWLVVALVAALVGTGQVGKVIIEALSFFR